MTKESKLLWTARGIVIILASSLVIVVGIISAYFSGAFTEKPTLPKPLKTFSLSAGEKRDIHITCDEQTTDVHITCAGDR